MWSVKSDKRSTRRAARGREQLLVAAGKVIAERGLDNTRFTDVAGATSVSVSTLQYYFGSREDLLMAVIEHVSSEELHRLRQVAAQVADPRERLSRLIMVQIGEREDLQESGYFSIEVLHAAFRNPEVRRLYTKSYDARLALFRETLQDGIQQGVFPRTVSVHDASLQILATVDGLFAPLLLEYGSMDRSKMQQLAADLVTSVLNVGLRISESA
jgi:AcrR family transcriptional regulator